MNQYTLALLSMLLAAGSTCAAPVVPDAKRPEPREAVEQAVREQYTAIASPKEADRVAAVKAMLPTKKDVDTLFPKHAERLWPLFERYNERRLMHVAEIAKELTRHGAVKRIELHDRRKDPKRGESFDALFEMIPATVAVFDYSIDFEKGAASGGAYLFVNGRTIFIKDVETIPEYIQKELGQPEKKRR